jgi:pimeloyl-ACP methyl ester carboxylesterase
VGRARAASIVLVLALVGALGVVAPAAGQTAAHPCAAATERCDGEIEVPLDWSDPGSERIAVAFAWVPRADTTLPAEGTILANPGGPSAALNAVELFEQALGPVLTRQNLLVVEPRGLGRSGALTCPGLDLARPATVEACATDLGPRVRFFSADQAVTDMAAVARALGVDEVTFYGNSYGTLFGQAFATRHPERTGAVFLDSVVYTRPDGYTNGLTAGQAIRAGVAMMDVVCEPSRPCRALPERGRDRWSRVLDVLRARPDSRVGWLQLMQMTAFVDDAVIGREVNAAAAAYLRGDEAPLRRLSQALATVFPPDDSELRIPEFAGTLAYVCADSAFPFDREAPTERRLRQLERHYATEQPYWPFTVEEALGVFGGDYPEWCARWPTPRPSPPVPPGAAYPPVPTLVVNGELDTTTPPWDAAAIAARFGRSTFVNVRFGTHASGFGLWGPYSECVRDAMRSFIARPRHPVADPGCSGENYRALGTFPRTARDVPRALGLRGSGGRLVAAAFATAADALARRNPYASLMAGLTEEPGLRGGQVRFDDQARTIQLDGVRFVQDVAVSGRIRWDGDAATADLTLSAGKGGRRALQFGWTPFRAEDVTRVAGALDGRRFVAWVRAG